MRSGTAATLAVGKAAAWVVEVDTMLASVWQWDGPVSLSITIGATTHFVGGAGLFFSADQTAQQEADNLFITPIAGIALHVGLLRGGR